MKNDRKESTSMIIGLSLSLGILLAVILINFTLIKKPSFYIDLRQYPIYGREGALSPWKEIAPAGNQELVIVKEKFDVPRRTFLSPFGQSPKEYTYFITFDLPPEIFYEFDRVKTITPGIYLAAIGDNWEVYLNGTLIRSEIHLNEAGEITSHRAQRKVRFPFDNGLLQSGANVLDFRLIGDPNHDNLGFYYGRPHYITYYSYIDKASGEYFSIALIGIYFFIGIYHLLIFMMRPQERYNLYYSLFSVILGIYFFTRTSVIYRITPDTNIWARVEFAALFMFSPLLSAFFEELTRQRLLLPTKIYGVLCLVISLAECLFSPQFGEDAIIFWWPTIAVWIVYIFAMNFGYAFFYRIYREWKKQTGKKQSLFREYLKQIGATPLGNITIGLFLVFLTGGFDIIDSIFLNIGILTSIYGFTVFTLGIAFILARKFGDLYNQLNLANITLEGTVKERTRELEEQTIIAVSASRAKTDFLANMSHEIRTPLNAVLGFSELVLLEPGEKKEKPVLRKIHNSASQLLGIINDILDISKIESGKLELRPEEYDLASLLNDAVTLNIVRIGSKPIAFSLELDEALPSRLYGDELRLRQILNNLLSNAIKYTKEGKVELSVTSVASTGEEVCLQFAVRDTGIGIKQEDLEKIFFRYDQASGAERGNIEGTGLGLAITRQLAQFMGGGITVESEYGKGSVFTVTLRQAVVSSAPIGREVALTLKNLSFQDRRLEKGNFQRLQMPDVRVLVVDDVPSNLDVARGFLSLYGMKVDCAQSGEDAIKILRENAALYDLVFMDYMMPGIDGQAALKILRGGIGGVYAGSLPVIALTANAFTDSEEMFLKMGFQDFISKPIDALKLDAVLKKWIPEDKIEKAIDAPVTPDEDAALSGQAFNLVIEGVNTVKGFENSGGDDEGYRYMLDSFCKDSAEKMDSLRHIQYHFNTAENLNNADEKTNMLLAAIMRTMKNSAFSIGAEALAREAAELEDKVKAKNINALLSELPAFYRHLQNITDRIREALG